MDKNKLFETRLEEETYEIPEVGEVTYRAVSRTEQLYLTKIDDPVQREREMVVMAMVDPPMDINEVKRWQKASPGGELEHITVRIATISGMIDDEEETDKDVVKRFPDDADI